MGEHLFLLKCRVGVGLDLGRRFNPVEEEFVITGFDPKN